MIKFQKIREHKIMCCDKCKRVPTPHEYGVNLGHFVVLKRLKDGTFGKGITNAFTFARIGALLKANRVGVCRSCLLGLDDVEAKIAINN